MTIRDTLIAVLMNTSTDYLDERFGPDTEIEDIADRLLGDHRDAALRSMAERIREVGTAKGWSVWAAPYIDPDVEFVETGMPSTAAIVTELRRADRAAVLIEAADRLESIADATEAKVAEHYGPASGIGPGSADMVREAARTVRSMADQPRAGAGR